MTDQRTAEAYEKHAREIASRDAKVASPMEKYFAIAFKPGSRVLDVGAGSGRELVPLLRERFNAYGVEPSAGLRQIARERIPAERVLEGSLPNLGLAPEYDGVLCSAVLQHLPRSQLFDAVLDLRGVLRAEGRALVAIPSGPGRALDGEGRDELGRLFNDVLPAELQLLFERVGFSTLARWEGDDALGRPGIAWTTFLFEVGAAAGHRPIDQLATVLSTRERKVATYKLALLRALTDIAMTQAHLARWRGADASVGVPLDAIAERWVLYYWPLFEAPTFLPQQNGEQEKQVHLLGFSKPLNALRQHYARRGGLTEFTFDRATLDPAATRLHQALMKSLRRVIVTGPVKYAGGSLPGRLFEWDAARGEVVVSGGLWRELSLLGHWIGDALLLRWAELIERLSKQEVRAADALHALLFRPETDRDTSFVRELFSDGAQCVWTGRAVRGGSLEIDHVLPWSLWRNNELWNLVPASRHINNEKSDQLPERQFLKSRRPAFLEAWQRMHLAAPSRFMREAEGQIGRHVAANLDLDELFDVMTESVERTRIQRGLGWWRPRDAA